MTPLQEAQEGREPPKVEGSPTFVLRAGGQISYLALQKVTLDAQQHARVVKVQPAACHGHDCLEQLRSVFTRAVEASVASYPFGAPRCKMKNCPCTIVALAEEGQRELAVLLNPRV